MRIIAGTAKGHPLKTPRGTSVRPTSDRVKETLFNVLGQWLDGERVLDLYAGVGALGLESLSRGASHATFVERDRATMAALADNLRALGFAARSTTLLQPVERALRRLAGESASFELVLADPPYALGESAKLLESLDAGKLVAPGGRVVVEHDRREALPDRAGSLSRVDERTFGDTRLSFYARAEVAPAT